MNTWNTASAIVALSMYIPLGHQIFKGIKKQNIATWALWMLLDALAAASIFAQHGNWILPAAYVLGSATMITCMLRARTISWTWFETTTCMLVILCLIGWKMSGPRLATIMSTLSVVVATIPQLRDAYREPEEMPVFEFLGFAVSCTLSAIAGNAWTVEERFYPIICALLSALIVIVSCKKYVEYTRLSSA